MAFRPRLCFYCAHCVRSVPAASELAGLVETAHLLGSPRNAARLMKAFGRAKGGKGKPSTLAKLLRDLGIDQDQQS